MERRMEFEELIEAGRAPELRSWMIWQNQVYRTNCDLAGRKP